MGAGEVQLDNKVNLATTRSARWAYLAAGHTFVVLGVIGAFLPVMPTTIFLILAASCYARGSARFHARLMNHPTVGPAIREWQEHRSIRRRNKRIALVTIAASFALSVSVIPLLWVKIFHSLLGLGLLGFVARIRSRD